MLFDIVSTPYRFTQKKSGTERRTLLFDSALYGCCHIDINSSLSTKLRATIVCWGCPETGCGGMNVFVTPPFQNMASPQLLELVRGAVLVDAENMPTDR